MGKKDRQDEFDEFVSTPDEEYLYDADGNILGVKTELNRAVGFGDSEDDDYDSIYRDEDVGFTWDYRTHADETNAIIGNIYEDMVMFADRFKGDETIPNGSLIALAIELFAESLYQQNLLNPDVESERY